MSKSRFLMFALLLCLTPCLFAAEETVSNNSEAMQEISSDWGTITVDNYRLINNVWNKGAASNQFKQSVFVKEVHGQRIIGWRWNNPFSRTSVVSYPEVVYGDKAWDPPSGLKTEFPLQVGAQRIIADFNVNIQATGVYNMAFSLWAVSSLPASPKTISHEIMIWTFRKGMETLGDRMGTLEVNGIKYDAYIRKGWGDASGANSNKWTYVCFVARKPVMQGPLDISTFTDYLVEKKVLTTNNYISSLELGNEVTNGQGVTEISGFNITVQ